RRIARLAAARRARFRLRPDLRAAGPRRDVRRDGPGRQACHEPPRRRLPPPHRRLPAARGNVTDAGFGIYVHWPFCVSKCPYCDFNSHVAEGPVEAARWTRAYVSELEHAAGETPGRAVTS